MGVGRGETAVGILRILARLEIESQVVQKERKISFAEGAALGGSHVVKRYLLRLRSA